MAKTYVVGESNSAVRLDNHIGPWIVLNPIGDNDTVWKDVMSDPINGDKVIVVGSNTIPGTNRSIQVSLDAGLTWTIPGGSWIKCDYFYEVWYVDTNIIWAVGNSGNVVRSIDGGLTFDSVLGVPGLGVYFQTAGIHALDDQIAIVLGSPSEALSQSELYVWKTIDGGATWVLLSGGSLPNPSWGGYQDKGNANGIWMSPDQQRILAASSYNNYLSVDGGTTWVDVNNNIVRSGVHLTWFPTYNPYPQYLRHIGGFVLQVVSSNNNGSSFTLDRGLTLGDTTVQLLGGHFYSPFDGYYTITNQIFKTTDGAITGTLSYTNTVSPPNMMNFLAVWTSVEVPPFVLCFELTDCAGLLQPIYTQSDLTEHIGMVITLADEDNHELKGCWLVSETDVSCPDTDPIAVYKCFIDCEDCLPPDEPIRIPCPRIVDPGYNTGNCDPEIVEKALCDYSEMKYQQMLSIRYGIDYCCAPDEIRVITQKEKIELELLKGNDPSPNPCDPICNNYEINIVSDDSGETVYMDCFGESQTIITPINNNGLLPTLVGFCALNTQPPVSTITHGDESTDTYILEPMSECSPPWTDPRACSGYTGTLSNDSHLEQSFSYLDCNGDVQVITMNGPSKDLLNFSFCGLESQDITLSTTPSFSDIFTITEGICNNIKCSQYAVILNSSIAGSFSYLDCNGDLVFQDFPKSISDQLFEFCGQADQIITCDECGYFNANENGNC